jgi:hypothetical protein
MSDNFESQAESAVEAQAEQVAAPVEGEVVESALSDGELADASGGHIDTDTSLAHDVGTIIGMSARGYYELYKEVASWF